MKITVFGATGATGRCFLDLACSQGHEVTAYVRRPEAISDTAGIEVVAGTLDDEDKIAKAIGGADAVLNVLGPAQKDPGNPIIATATATIADVAIGEGVRRHVVVTAWGVGERRAETPWFFRAILLPTILKKSFAIKAQQEMQLADPVRAAGLDITIVCPAQLVKGDGRDYRAVADGRTIKAKVTRPGLAAFLLREIERGEWTGRSVVIGS